MSDVERIETIDHALEWMERLRADESASEAFFDWLTESPRHVEVFVQAMTLEQRIAAIEPAQWDGIRSQESGEADEAANVVPMKISNASTLPLMSAPRSIMRPVTAIAATIAVLAIAAGFLFQTFGGWQDFTTAVGEQRIVQLPDGSVVNLNTGSRLKVRISAQVRELRLLQGEALFKVHHDSGRPFRVHTRDAVIQAVGTQFNVYRHAHGTTVSVLEGRVRVAADAQVTQTASGTGTPDAPALLAGEQADVSRDGGIKRHAALDTARVTAWQQRRLVFDEDTLTDIVFEFNRYNRRHFRIQDPAAGARRFSGIFNADDPESLSQLLGRDSGLIVQRADDAIVVRTR